MDSIFLNLLSMSFTASFVIMAVLAIRLVLKKAPKIFSYAIWVVVLFRLLCPFSFESAIGLIPSSEPIPQSIVYEAEPQINTGFEIIDNSVNEILPSATPTASVNPIQIWIFFGRIIWSVAIFAILLYSVIQYVLLKRKLIGAKPLKDNIYLADGINSPFVMGLINPRIYLPSSLQKSEFDFIIAHEKCHIKRLDHITRVLSFIALALHWFNPFAWVAYILSAKDMEMSCDEAVLKNMGSEIRAEYAISLLRLATGKKMIFATPLAFGEGDTKSRVKNVMKYKKPVVWVSVVTLLVAVCVAVGFGTNRKSDEEDLSLLNPLILTDSAYQMENYVIVNAEDGTEIEISPQIIADFLNDDNLNRNNSNALELIPSYTFDINDTTISLYEIEPDLIKLHHKLENEVQYRYYTKNDIYTEFTELLTDVQNKADEGLNKISIDDLIMLSEKGEDLSWEDFEEFSYVDIGSGRYIYEYNINEAFGFVISGGSTSISPDFMSLYAKTGKDPEPSIDIRYESVNDFVSQYTE